MRLLVPVFQREHPDWVFFPIEFDRFVRVRNGFADGPFRDTTVPVAAVGWWYRL
jgi:hypothetical protein